MACINFAQKTSIDKAFSWLSLGAGGLILGWAYTRDFAIFRISWQKPKVKSVLETVLKI